ncbi:hypothetical protein ABK040_006173 [Willaertia magna]
MHDCCKQGHIHTGTPTGSITQIANRNTYIKRHNSNNGRAILFLHDAFGISFINNQLLVDTFAEQTQANVYMPDFFDGDAVPVEVMTNPQLQSNFDWNPWKVKHGRQNFPIIENYTKQLKLEENITKLVVIGYCWGGWGSILLGSSKVTLPNLVDGVVLVHPSMLEIPTDIENLEKPNLFICAEIDHAFPEEARNLSKTILEKKMNNFVTIFKLFMGVRHGFAVRFNSEDKVAANAAEEAKNVAVEFFKKILN